MPNSTKRAPPRPRWRTPGAFARNWRSSTSGLPGRTGLSIISALCELGVHVVVLSAYTQPLYAQRALEAGALGYVTKSASPQMLLDALRAAAEGRRFIEPEVAQDLALRHVAAGGKLDRLTPRELDILRLLAAGRSLTEIAASLSVSYKTVANTSSTMRTKLGTTRMADLIRLAIGMKLMAAALLEQMEDPLGGKGDWGEMSHPPQAPRLF